MPCVSPAPSKNCQSAEDKLLPVEQRAKLGRKVRPGRHYPRLTVDQFPTRP